VAELNCATASTLDMGHDGVIVVSVPRSIQARMWAKGKGEARVAQVS
jgi:hypothetical protein